MNFIQNLKTQIKTKIINILTKSECENITNYIEKNINISELSNDLNELSFKNSKNFSIDYKKNDNVFEKYKVNKLEKLYYIYKKYIEDELANEYYFNLLWLNNTNSIKDNSNKYAVEPHKDSTLNYEPTKVCVLYLKIPDELDGGFLEIFNDVDDITVVKPETGMLVIFDAIKTHAITHIKCNKNNYRLSAVWEIYY